MKQVRFKGGPIRTVKTFWLNSGGRGPDDYLLKPVEGGRWTAVIFRWGRNFTGNVDIAQEDKIAMENIMPVSHVCALDNAQRYAKMVGRGNVPTMGASEFWAKYKDYPLVRVGW